MLNNKLNKYFWDSSSESFSEEFQLRRIIEYASFPDLIQTPFDLVRRNINKIDFSMLRTNKSRIELINVLKHYLVKSNSWEEAIKDYVNDCLSQAHILEN